MLRWLCNHIIRWLLPHSDYATAGYECRALARAEIAIARAHLNDATAFLEPLPPVQYGTPRWLPKPRPVPIRRLPVRPAETSPAEQSCPNQ